MAQVDDILQHQSWFTHIRVPNPVLSYLPPRRHQGDEDCSVVHLTVAFTYNVRKDIACLVSLPYVVKPQCLLGAQNDVQNIVRKDPGRARQSN